MESINLTPEEETKFIKWLQYQAFISHGISEQMKGIGIPDTLLDRKMLKALPSFMLLDTWKTGKA